MWVLVKEPQRIAELREIDDADVLGELQEIVGGYIETYPMGPGLVIICNEDGKLSGLRPNLYITGQGRTAETIVGTVAVIGVAGADFKGITDSGVIHYIKGWLERYSIDKFHIEVCPTNKVNKFLGRINRG